MPGRYLLALGLGIFLALTVGYDLGVFAGLGVGVPVLAVVSGLYFWFRRTGEEVGWVWTADGVDGVEEI